MSDAELTGPADPSAAAPSAGFLRRHWQKLVALGFWLAVLVGYQAYALASDLGPGEAVDRLLDLFEEGMAGPLIFIAIYAVRPLVLLSAALLTVAAGFAFGAAAGILLTIVAANLSAAVAFVVGRYFGRGLLAGGESAGIAGRYADRMRRSSFETVFVMRLVFLPYDLVNYLAGFLRIRFVPFILATALGSLPGTVAFVLFGASIDDFDGGLPSFNPWVLVAAVALFVASLLVARLVRRREGAAR